MLTAPPPSSRPVASIEEPSSEPLRREPEHRTIRELLDRLNQLLNLNDFSRGDVFRD